jgi:hypothetical protein
MRKQVAVVAVVVFALAFAIGCAGKKPPVMQDGKQVGIFILSDRGITAGMKEDERNDRNEMGQTMEEDMLNWYNRYGYMTTMIKSPDQFVSSPTNYLVTVKILELRLVGRAARQWTGMAAGPTRLKNHYEVSGPSNKLNMSYEDEESTFRDFLAAPNEMNIRLWKKIDEKLNPGGAK